LHPASKPSRASRHPPGGVFLACTLPDRCDGALFAVSLASFLMIDALVAVAVVLWLIALGGIFK